MDQAPAQAQGRVSNRCFMTIRRAPDLTDPTPIAETTRIALFRSVIGLGILVAFIPSLPTIVRSLGWARPPTYRTVDCTSAGLHIEEKLDGKRAIHLRPLDLCTDVYGADNPYLSDYWLLEDGMPMQRHVFVDQFAEMPGGFRHSGNQILFRSSLATLADKPSNYAIRIPQYSDVERQVRAPWLQGLADALVAWLLVGCVILTLLVAISPHPRNMLFAVGATGPRLALVAVVVLRLSLALASEWNQVALTPDSNSYIKNHTTRSPLYPELLDYLAPEKSAPAWEFSNDPNHPLLTAVRTAKLFWLASIAFFVWTLSRLASPWLLALIFGWVAGCDAQNPWQSQWQMLSYVMTEPLNYSLTFAHLGLLFVYVARPSWKAGLTLALSLSLLMLCRPQNFPLFLSFAVVALADYQVGGWRLAVQRTATLAAVASLFLPIQYAFNLKKGAGGTAPPLTGHSLTGFAVQFASADDIPHIQDPKIREVLRTCIEVNGWRRKEKYSPSDRSMDANIYEVAVPSLRAVYGNHINDIAADHVLGVIARTIICRHPLEYLSLVFANAKMYWRPWVHIPLLATIAISAWAFAKNRDCRFLIPLLLALLPLLFAVLYCVLARPHGRYTSQFAFAEYMAPPLLLAFLFQCRVRTCAYQDLRFGK